MHTAILILALAVYTQSALAAYDVPEACKHLTYCTVKPPNYPQQKFNDLYKDVVLLVEPPPANEITIDNRDSIPGEEDNCATHITVDPVYSVREGLDKPWRTVIQAPGVDYVQKVRIERCVEPNAKCFNVFQSKATSQYFVTYCEQKNIYYNFLVEKSEGSKETETVKAELPACCSCRYKSI